MIYNKIKSQENSELIVNSLKANNLGDLLLEKIGGHGKYQILLTINLFFIGIFIDYYLYYTNYMATVPKVDFIVDGITFTSTLNDTICEKYLFTIRDDSIDSWVKDKNICCNKLLKSFVGESFFFGCLIGSLLVKFIKNLGHKNGMIICCLSICLFSCFLLFQNFYLNLVVNFFFGIANVNVFMIKNTTMTELTDKKYRSFFMYSQFASSIASLLIYYILFKKNIKWIYIYSANAIFLLIFTIINFYFAVENPRFLLEKKDDEKLIKCVNCINQYNKTFNSFNQNDLDELRDNKDSLINVISDENLIQGIENFTETSEEKNKKLKKLIYFIFTFFIYVLIISATGYEMKNYLNEITNSAYYIANCSLFFTFFVSSAMMNISFLGRKFTLIIISIINFTLRTVKIFTGSIYLYLSIKMTLYSAQVPFHTLITESFSTKERLRNYGILFLFSKLTSLLPPILIEYLSSTNYDIFLSTIGFLLICLLFFSEETLGKHLNDI